MDNPKQPNQPLILLGWIVAFFVLLVLFTYFSQPNKNLKPEQINVLQLKSEIAADNVQELNLEKSVLWRVNGKRKAVGQGKSKDFFVDLTEGQLEDVSTLAAGKMVPLKVHVPDVSLLEKMSLMLNLFWMVILVLIFLSFSKAVGNQSKTVSFFSKSKAKQYKHGKITFADVAGCDEAKEELQEVVEFLKNPKKFQRLGGKVPKGVLLYGPPGNGKTLLAKAVAGEAGVPFCAGSGAEFVEMFVGVGAARVRDLFDQARKNRPAVVFIDELDAVGRHRFAGIGGGHDEREQTLNQILVELDGFATEEGIILIAATNRPDVLDPALLRPGRFDRHINVPPSDVLGREAILKVHAKGIKLDEQADLKIIARRTPGFSGADLANLLNEAAILAARRNADSVRQQELEEAIERVIAGPEKKTRVISESERKIIAYHEAGHTLVAKLTPGSDPVHKVSIISRDQALGYTLQLPLEDKHLYSKKELLAKVGVLLGGRVAEELKFKEVTDGACDDLKKATGLVRKMVTEFSMGTKLSVVPSELVANRLMQGQDAPRYSQHYLKEVDHEVENILQDAKKQVAELLEKNMETLAVLAEALLKEETLDSERIDAIIQSVR